MSWTSARIAGIRERDRIVGINRITLFRRLRAIESLLHALQRIAFLRFRLNADADRTILTLLHLCGNVRSQRGHLRAQAGRQIRCVLLEHREQALDHEVLSGLA